MSHTTKVAFLGAGYIADWHAKAIRGLKNVEIVGVCDRVPTLLQNFSAKWGIPKTYSSLKDMLENCDLDVVHVLLPPQLHFQSTKAILEAGKDVLLEKPMTTSSEQAKILSKLAADNGRRLGISHNFLFHPKYLSLVDDLKNMNLGPLSSIDIRWAKPLPQLNKSGAASWLFANPANIIFEIAPHSLAHLMDLMGSKFESEARAFDCKELSGERSFYRKWQVKAWNAGCVANLDFSFEPGFSEHFIHVRGLLGAATVDFEQGTYTLCRHGRRSVDFDRFDRIKKQSEDLKGQAKENLKNYIFSKAKISSNGNMYEISIRNALESFYAEKTSKIDSRLSPEFATQVIALCEKIIVSSGVSQNSNVERVADNRSHAPEVLVLGASGFIGQELVKQLTAQKIPVRIFSRSKIFFGPEINQDFIEFFEGDLRNNQDIEKSLSGIRTVYHLARAMVQSWKDYFEQDVCVTKTIGELCARNKIRLVYTGTIDSYYAGNENEIISENTPLDLRIKKRNLYAQAKAMSEEILQKIVAEQKLPLIIFRPGIVVGSGSSPLHWGVGFWSHGIVCEVWGRGENPLPFVLVSDVATALIAVLGRDDLNGESFNLIGDVRPTALEYLFELEKKVKSKLSIFQTPIWKFFIIDFFKYVVKICVRHPERRMPSFRDWSSRSQKAQFDCSKAKETLNWKPTQNRELFYKQGVHAPADEFLL
jgi:predicted dehydrogenase/nucleoside-diphosphate-sugar epimerase